jgi:hydroxymethylglutaryl-CoA lyase
MADIDSLVRQFTPASGVRYTALALNRKGLERRAAYIPPLVAESWPPMLLCHMCDTFVRRNTNRSQQDEIGEWPAIVDEAVAVNARSGAIGVNATFGSNFEGFFPLEDRMRFFRQQHELWDGAGIPVTHVYIGDPMGWVMPHWVEEQISALRAEWPGIRHFWVHLHNARGLALAATYETIRLLDADQDVYFDTTAGGIGGCPYCGNGRTTGLAATEDVANMLTMMGIPNGVDLKQLIRTVWLLEEMIGRTSFGHVSKSGPHPGPGELYDPNLPLIETFEEAKHFLLGEDVASHQLRPWSDPIPAPRGVGLNA